MKHAFSDRIVVLRLTIVLAGSVWSGSLPAGAQTQTPPIQPKVQETPLPPRVQIPPPPTVPPDVTTTQPITADEAARIALRHQPNITVAQQAILAAQGVTQQARSGLLPTLGVGAGYTYTKSLSGNGAPVGAVGTGGTSGGSIVTVSGYQASATIRQLIFDFNHTLEQVRQSSALEHVAAANLTRVQSDLVLAVKQAFYTYVQDERLVSVNEGNVRNQQDHLAEAQARLRAGLGLPADVVQAETAVSDAILNLNLARQTADTARINLALQMGIDPRTPIQPSASSSEPAAPSNDVQALVDAALRQRPEILSAQANIESNQHGLNAAKTTSAPSVAANLGLATRDSSFPPHNDSLSIGATIQWTPFDAGLTAGRVKEARANLETARADLLSAQLSVTSDVAQAYLALRTAEQRITTSDAEVVNAQENVRLQSGRYRAGLGLFLNVLDAQTSLLTAQANRVNAQSAVDQARAALVHAMGAPIPAPR